MWQTRGDCFIHFHKHSGSTRAPVFRIPFQILHNSRCNRLLDKFLAQNLPASSLDGRPKTPRIYELYIPVPANRDPFTYYLKTRNFFAWTLDRSLVGLPNLGRAFVGLLESMNEFRCKDEDNVSDIMEYLEREGYLDMMNHPDHALAVLFFAEYFEFRDLWLDAFAHCTGMYDQLHTSPEFEVSRQL